MSVILPALIGIAAWLAVNFVGRPILALRESRLEALKISERYSGVSSSSSDSLRHTALKALNDTGNILLAYGRERSIATRIWCYLFRYDLEIAARCIFGLAEGARGEFSVDAEVRKNTLNALYVSLGVTHHMSPAQLAAVKKFISEQRIR